MSALVYCFFLRFGQWNVLGAWNFGDRYLDTPKLLEHGAFPVTIGIYCLATIGFDYLGFRQQCVRLLSHLQIHLPRILPPLSSRKS